MSDPMPPELLEQLSIHPASPSQNDGRAPYEEVAMDEEDDHRAFDEVEARRQLDPGWEPKRYPGHLSSCGKPTLRVLGRLALA